MSIQDEQFEYEEEPPRNRRPRKDQRAHFDRNTKRRPVSALTEAQGHYITNILNKTITFGVGPAGTGKTYIAAALAADALASGDAESVVICRPMVGCDEDMGFLPGREDEKYLPWIEPLIDVLEERLGKSQVHMYLKNGRIQAKPLMLMRGKTHKDTWVLLDEAQNTTPNQMKMFLTRVGEGSKIIIDGDLQQSDLRDKRGVVQQNGLEDAVWRLQGIADIGIVEFDMADIVRHGLVREILEAYSG